MSEIKGDIIQYLESLSDAEKRSLYKSPCSCLVITSLLPSLAIQVIYRLLYHCGPLNIDSWIADKTKLQELQINKQKLFKLQIIIDDMQKIKLEPSFQNSLHCALTGTGTNNDFGIPAAAESVTVEFLDQYASKSWEKVLHYLVGTNSKSRPSDDIIILLRESGLMEGTKELHITSKGFQFLLQDMKIQVWALLIQFLDVYSDLNKVEIISFLFQLSTLELGKSYSTVDLSPAQRTLVDKFRYLGLIYQKNKKESHFYPTRMATSLTTGHEMEVYLSDQSTIQDMDHDSRGYILAETNFRVYAYTMSPLQIAILSLFVDMHSRFVNMIVGVINRDSIRGALMRGITADQYIISYMQSHAHPEMRKSIPIVPATIVDQIKLWEMELNRFTARKGVLWLDIIREQDYLDVRNYAQQFDYVLWFSDNQKRLVLTPEGHEAVKEWIIKRKQQ